MDMVPSLKASLADRYIVERELGAGGMATVFLAHDVRHDRKVALKVLRSDLAAVIGAERFLVEIRTTANLQHPHILPLHDSGEVDGTVFYVMPYVEGESIRDRLNRETQLPVDEAVRIAVEVAGALEYAHQHKVIHRDIKPENIMLHGGHALVADFGIALAASRTDGNTRMTETGMSLGTPQYMSPEQAMGEREITAKSDVYALGAVLYEMLSGEPPFSGPTAQAIVARVMTDSPRSLVVQRRTVPPHVEAAVNRALEKLPADRFASAAGFADALTNPAAMAPALLAHALGAAPRGGRAVAIRVAAAVAVLTGAVAFVAGRQTASEQTPALGAFALKAPDSVVLTSRCCGVALALSPDGRTLVFVGAHRNGGPLYRRALGRTDAEPIPGTEGASVPFFSPDGQWLGFFADGRLRKVSMSGGPPIPITTADGVSEASWSEAGTIIFASGDRLRSVLAAGGESVIIAEPDSGTRYYAPTFLPGGSDALFSMRRIGGSLEEVRIGVVDVASGKVDTIGFGTRARYANGYLVYAGADNTLLAQPFDAKRRRTTGSAVSILDRVAVKGNTTHEFTLSSAGDLVYELNESEAGGGEALHLNGPAGDTVITLPGRRGENLEDPAFSPDGRRIALRLQSAGSAGQDLWMLDRQQGTLDRFTVGEGFYPSWSADGRLIAYTGASGIEVKSADGTGDARLVLRATSSAPGSWLPDGKALVFRLNRGSGRGDDIGVVSLADTVPRWLVATEFQERHPQLSPDGRWLAYSSNRTGQFEVYVQPFVGDGPRVQVSTEGATSPRWSRDGRTLYYVAGNSIVAASRAPGAHFELASRNVIIQSGVTDLNASNVNWDIHPDGKRFLYIDLSGSGGTHLVWILNWPEMVKAMAPAK